MIRNVKALFNKSRKHQRGYVYILVLVFLLIGALMIPPLLGFVGTGAQSGKIFERRTDELYAADAGVDDAVWRINYENLTSLTAPIAYDEYDYTTVWPYELAEEINDNNVSVSIANVWMPKDIAAPNPDQARDIIDAEKLRVYGSRTGPSSFQIRISFVPENEEERNNMHVTSIGVWLPTGYHYDVTVSSNLEDPFAEYNSVPDVQKYEGGEVVIWDFSPSVQFSKLPPAGSTETAVIEFDFISETERNLETVSWITTTGQVQGAEFSWDYHTKVYAITSTAAGTYVESNVSKGSICGVGTVGGVDFEGAIVCNNRLHIDKNSTVYGDIYARGDITMNTGDEIFGNASTATGQITGGTVHGKIREGVDPVEWPPIPDTQIYADQASVNYYEGDYTVGQGPDTITIGPLYVTGDLHIGKYNTIVLEGTVFVEGGIQLDRESNLVGLGNLIAQNDITIHQMIDTDPNNCIFVMSTGGNIVFNQAMETRAIIYSPTGNVTLHQDATLNGSVIGNDVYLSQNSSISYDPSIQVDIELPAGVGGISEKLIKLTYTID